MKRIRAIMFFAAFAVLCGGGVARAQEDAPSAPVVVAQAGGSAAAYSDDSDPATKGDFRRLQDEFGGLRKEVGKLQGDVIRLDERMDAQERELRHLREEMSAIRDMMHSNFQWLMAAIIAVLGLPQFLSWLGRMRGNGRSVAAGLFMVALPAAAIVAALLLTDNAAAQENEPAQVVRAQSEQGNAALRGDRPATLDDLRESEGRINGQMGRLEERMGERMERLENRMGERMERLEERMDGQIQSLRGDIMGIHNILYALIFTLLAGVGGVVAVMFGILMRDRRKGMISGAATMAFMAVVGSFMLGSCEAEAQTVESPPSTESVMVDQTPVGISDERCNEIVEKHNARLAAISENIGMELTESGWHVHNFCDAVANRFRSEQLCTAFVSKRLYQVREALQHFQYRECEYGYVSDFSDTAADNYNECVVARKCKAILRIKQDIRKEDTARTGGRSGPGDRIKQDIWKEGTAESRHQQEFAALAKESALLIAEIASKIDTPSYLGHVCNKVAELYNGGVRRCRKVVLWRRDQLIRNMSPTEFRKCEYAYLFDVSNSPVDNYNECIKARKREASLQKERERAEELELARRQANQEAERINRENKHREALAKERARVAESTRESLEAARAAEVAAAQAEQRAELARQETERQVAEARARGKAENRRVETPASAERRSAPVPAPSVQKRWKSLSVAELSSACTEVAQQGHNVDIDSWGLWDDYNTYSGKFLAFDSGEFHGRNFKVACNVMTCADALVRSCESQSETVVLIGLIDPISGEVVRSFAPVRWGH